jgi:hypothetical protein
MPRFWRGTLSLPFNASKCSEDRRRPFEEHRALALKEQAAWAHVFRVVVQIPGGGAPRRTARTGRPATSAWPVHPPAGWILGRLARVTMMEAADHGGLDDPALVTPLHWSWLWRILAQRKVCSGAVIVDEVPAQQATQMGFGQHHDVVETLAAEGANSAKATEPPS